MNPECNIITLGFTPRCCYLFNLGLNPDIKISTVGFKPSLTAGLNDLTSCLMVFIFENFPYTNHMREMLHEMMKSDELTDVQLISAFQRQFKAHKIVLSACSAVNKTKSSTDAIA